MSDDIKPRDPGCECHLEEGDSPCPIHGEDEPACADLAAFIAFHSDHDCRCAYVPGGPHMLRTK